ncbi:MAG: GNAT family N-acetyltransferase [Deltaproteobacteria bacterium]|nr:GNAT family N-acetyltransferase [Deltaproteobacteria bacterium]
MNINIRPCLITELDMLQKIGYETFNEAFRSMNSQETMDKYFQKAFNKEKLAAELNNRYCKFYFLYADNDLAGYLKVNDVPAQSDINDPESMEVERIYIRKAYKEKGIGKKLINYALQLAIEMKKKYVWLGVWEKNVDAISFYTKMGFREVGRHSFRMGDELQYDLIMKKVIKNDSSPI